MSFENKKKKRNTKGIPKILIEFPVVESIFSSNDYQSWFVHKENHTN